MASMMLVFVAVVGILAFVVYKFLFQSTEITYKSRHVVKPPANERPEYPTADPGPNSKFKKHWVTEPHEEKPIFYSKTGAASWKAETIFDMFERGVSHNPHGIEIQKEYINPVTKKYEWRQWTRVQHLNDVKAAARALIKLGLEPWHSVVCIGFNAPEWLITNLGTIYAGGLIAGLYTTNNPGQCSYISKHCRANIAVVENEKQLKKFLEIRSELKDYLKAIIVWDVTDSVLELKRTANKEGDKIGLAHVYEWNEFMTFGGENSKDYEKLNNEMNRRIRNIKPSNCCTLIYTSGTTGPPKGVMLSHDCLTWQTRSFWDTVVKQEAADITKPQSIISYLPLSHAAGQLLDIYFPMALRSWYPQCPSMIVTFARPDALRGSLGETLKAAKPTVFFGVPRVWEKLSEAIIKKARANPSTGLKLKLVNWAKSVGIEYFKNSQSGHSRVKPFGYNFAKLMVFNKVRSALGFENLQMAYTGAAPVQPQTLEFFSQLGINIYEAYGMSETTGAHTICVDYNHVIGTVGIDIDGVETMIDQSGNNAASNSQGQKNEGEICMRGRNIMMGYMYDPEKTERAIDNQGFMHSGDIGEINKYGLLRITGRIKELVITAGGENIAPVPIEDYIKGKCPAISNVILIGDKKKYLSILVTLKLDQNLETLEFSSGLTGDAKNVDPNCKTVQDAQKSDVWAQYIQKGIDAYNSDSDYCVSRAQRVQKFTILDCDFSVPGGTLTSTLKLKRPIIHQKFEKEIASLY